MFVALAGLVLAPTAAPTAKTDWYDCLEIYAQTAMAGTATPITITLDAFAACSAERGSAMRKLADRTFAAREREDRAAALHTIAFVNRLRRADSPPAK